MKLIFRPDKDDINKIIIVATNYTLPTVTSVITLNIGLDFFEMLTTNSTNDKYANEYIRLFTHCCNERLDRGC